MAGQRLQIKYHTLEQQYALMERLYFLKTEELIQSDPELRFTLLKQIEQIQQERDSIEQQIQQRNEPDLRPPDRSLTLYREPRKWFVTTGVRHLELTGVFVKPNLAHAHV